MKNDRESTSYIAYASFQLCEITVSRIYEYFRNWECDVLLFTRWLCATLRWSRSFVVFISFSVCWCVNVYVLLQNSDGLIQNFIRQMVFGCLNRRTRKFLILVFILKKNYFFSASFGSFKYNLLVESVKACVLVFLIKKKVYLYLAPGRNETRRDK